MDKFLTLLLPLLIAAGCVFLFLWTTLQQRQQLLNRVATRFRGRLENNYWFEHPVIRLQFQGAPALLQFRHGSNRGSHTVFSIAWPDSNFRCEIYPQDIFSGFRKLLGTEDIQIGSPQFDAAFFIAGTDRAAVRQVLSAEVQSLIFRLLTLTSSNVFVARDIQVRWAGGLLSVTKPAMLATYESLEQFLSLSALLYSAALATRHSGIEFLGEVREPDAIESQCQVCGEALTGELVYCASCETPHHRDCWHYFGGCSTYACGQKKFLPQPTRERRKAS